jgi:hypothetical protein
MPATAATPAQTLDIGGVCLHLAPRAGFGQVVRASGAPSAYLDGILADDALREQFFAFVDREGLVVCQALDIDPGPYRTVGGRRSQRRLSQGEYYHHDGCSSPTKPRVVEIRCPPQRVLRTMSTAVAPFPEVVGSMLEVLPVGMRRGGGLDRFADAVVAGEPPEADWDHIQGVVNRVIRQLGAEDARAYFHDVDTHVGAYVAPWTFGESRFMANHNGIATVQHRRACLPPWRPGTPNGQLLKRWPHEEIGGWPVAEACERGACVG